MFNYIQTGQRLIILSPTMDPAENGGYIFAMRGDYTGEPLFYTIAN